MDLLGPRGQCGERLRQHRAAAQLAHRVLLAVHPVAQRTGTTPAQVGDERLLGHGVGHDALGRVGGRRGPHVGDQIA
jgi:hypothetical protein